MNKTLYDKVWDAHVVGQRSDGTILYIDQHLLHEVTSPQAFEGLRAAGRSPWRLGANLATPDHNVPTQNRAAGIQGIDDPIAREQVMTLDRNCNDFGIRQF
ncbi:MAG: aconitase family protein, partial [Pseudomonadota bacterium]|nr:aconitase family protein [Pseudomonadota bacterium]